MSRPRTRLVNSAFTHSRKTIFVILLLLPNGGVER